jgi:DNA-binding transcriptional LysR family regulator
MYLRRLRYFVIAAEEENFHRAATRLHVAQPALSKQIALLESELGCALFARHKGRVFLTDVGRIFLADTRRILRDLELAAERAREATAGQLGVLNVGLRETAGRSPIVSRAFSQFRQAYPGVELRLHPMTSPAQSAALQAGDLDVGFIYLSAGHDRELQRFKISNDRFHLALPHTHPLAQRRHIHLRDLEQEPFIWLARSRNAYYSDTLLRTCLDAGMVPRIIQEVDGESTALNLVAVGMGVSFIVAPTDVSPQPDIVFKRVVELNTELQLALVWPERAESSIVANFVATVRAIADSHRKTREGSDDGVGAG